MPELKILKNRAGGATNFDLQEDGENVFSSSQIEDLAEKIVEEYPEAAKEIVDRKRQSKHTDTDDDYVQIGSIFFWDCRPSERDRFCNTVHDLFVEEFSFVDMDSEE